MTTATASPASADAGPGGRRPGNAYNIFILVLTVMSLLIMVLMWLPFGAVTIELLRFYDNIICVIFLIDFGLTLKRSPSKRRYLLRERGWLDLLGSIPTLPGAQAAGVLRLARLSRLARIIRLLRGQNQKQLVADVVRNRAQYAAVVTVLLAILVLTTSSIVVLAVESRSPDANITNGGDALWWAVVTITTVGYGDRYPTTVAGRTAAVFVMVMGIGIIGALASIMASLLVSPSPEEDQSVGGTGPLERELVILEGELASVKHELAGLRQVVERLEGHLSPADLGGSAESPAGANRMPNSPN